MKGKFHQLDNEHASAFAVAFGAHSGINSDRAQQKAEYITCKNTVVLNETPRSAREPDKLKVRATWKMEFDPLNASASKLTSLLYELVALPIVKLEEPKRLYFQLGGSNNAARTLFLHLQEHVFIVCYMGDLQSPRSEPYPMNAKIIYQRVLDPIFESGVHKLACCVYMAKVVNDFKARYAGADGYVPGDTSMLVIPTIHVISPKLLKTALRHYSGYDVGTRGNSHFILNDTMHVILDCESLSFYTNPLEPVSVTYPHYMQLNLESMRVSSELEYGSRATDAFLAFLLNFVRSQQQVMNSEPQVCPPPVQGVAVTLKAASEYSAFDAAKDSGTTRAHENSAPYTGDALHGGDTSNGDTLNRTASNRTASNRTASNRTASNKDTSKGNISNGDASNGNNMVHADATTTATQQPSYVSPLVNQAHQTTSQECDYPDTEALLIADDPALDAGTRAPTVKPMVTQVRASSYSAFEAAGLAVGNAQISIRSTFASMFGSRSAMYASGTIGTHPMPLFLV